MDRAAGPVVPSFITDQKASRGARGAPAASSPSSRVMPGLMVMVGAVIMTALCTIIAVAGIWGPELMDDAPGGAVFVSATACGFHTEFFERECFESANVTVTYADGFQESVASRGFSSFAHEADVDLKWARARIDINTDLGTWTREVWLPAGQRADIDVSPESPRSVSAVEGRHTGAGFLFLMLASVSAVHAVATLVWLVKGNLRAAQLVRSLLTGWVVLYGVLVVVALFVSALGLGLVILAGLTWWVRWMISDWIKEEEAWLRGTPEPIDAMPA